MGPEMRMSRVNILRIAVTTLETEKNVELVTGNDLQTREWKDREWILSLEEKCPIKLFCWCDKSLANGKFKMSKLRS